MAEEPANPRLWKLLVQQAKQKFNVYPSPAASHWVHKSYIDHGGQFLGSKKDIDPKMKDETPK